MDQQTNPPQSEFGKVDHTANPRGFVEFLDSASALDSVRGCKQRMLDLLGLEAGQMALDVGCGIGGDALALARAVAGGSGGQAVGIDNSAVMIREATARAADVPWVVRFEVGEATRLPFEDDHFDRCRAERLLLHLEEPRDALAEMRRVLKPGGRLVIFDLDWEGTIVDHPDRALTRRLLQMICDRHRHPWLGRQLPRLLRQAGFAGVAFQPYPIVTDYPFFKRLCKDVLDRAAELAVADPATLAAWDARLRADAEAGVFFASFSGFIAYGEKP